MNEQTPLDPATSIASDEAEGRLLLVSATMDIDNIGGAYFEDLWVPGIYEVRVPAELSDAHAANCALDAFNSAVPIKHLYSIELTVIDPVTGDVLERDQDIEYYKLKKLCLGIEQLTVPQLYFPFRY